MISLRRSEDKSIFGACVSVLVVWEGAIVERKHLEPDIVGGKRLGRPNSTMWVPACDYLIGFERKTWAAHAIPYAASRGDRSRQYAAQT